MNKSSIDFKELGGYFLITLVFIIAFTFYEYIKKKRNKQVPNKVKPKDILTHFGLNWVELESIEQSNLMTWFLANVVAPIDMIKHIQEDYYEISAEFKVFLDMYDTIFSSDDYKQATQENKLKIRSEFSRLKIIYFFDFLKENNLGFVFSKDNFYSSFSNEIVLKCNKLSKKELNRLINFSLSDYYNNHPSNFNSHLLSPMVNPNQAFDKFIKDLEKLKLI